MAKIIVSEFITADGVFEDPGSVNTGNLDTNKGTKKLDGRILNSMNNENLNKLIGTWNTTGVVVDGGEHDGTEIKGTDKYEWLGENFVLHTADVTFGGVKQRTIEIFQLTDDGFDMTAYNSDGSVEKMKGRFDGEGVFRAGDDTIRTTLRIDSSGSSMSALWEMNQGGSWTQWMKMSFTK